MKFLILTLLMTLTGIGCVTTAGKKMSPEAKSYLEKTQSQQLTFTLPKGLEREAWGRAQAFIAQYSSAKIQTATDFVIETYNPEMGFGYKVTKTPTSNELKINVSCISGSFMAGSQAKDNAKILAYYMLTGEEPPEGLVNTSFAL